MASPCEKISANPVFEEFLVDLLQRMGMKPEHFAILFSPVNKKRNLKEFAKCFVTSNVDEHDNYEFYELAGDGCLNNAVIMYFFHTLDAALVRTEQKKPDFQRSKRFIDYYNKLKSQYISTKEFDDIARRLGFDEWLVFNHDPIHEYKFLADCFEAFIGCFEIMMNRYIESHYSHQYISNFITYIFESRFIDYHPISLYDPITLLKETNDSIKNNFSMAYKVQKDNSSCYLEQITYESHKSNKEIKKNRINAVGSLQGTNKETEAMFSRTVLEWLKKQGTYDRYIRTPPTLEELGLTSLVRA